MFEASIKAFPVSGKPACLLLLLLTDSLSPPLNTPDLQSGQTPWQEGGGRAPQVPDLLQENNGARGWVPETPAQGALLDRRGTRSPQGQPCVLCSKERHRKGARGFRTTARGG